MNIVVTGVGVQANESRSFEAIVRLETDFELVQYRHRGLLNYVARQHISS